MSLNGNQDENSQIENCQEMQVEQVEREERYRAVWAIFLTTMKLKVIHFYLFI